MEFFTYIVFKIVINVHILSQMQCIIFVGAAYDALHTLALSLWSSHNGFSVLGSLMLPFATVPLYMLLYLPPRPPTLWFHSDLHSTFPRYNFLFNCVLI